MDFLFIVTPIVGVCNCSSMFCCTLLYVHFSIAIILMGKRELIALLNLSSWCLVMVEQLFLAVPRGSLQFVIVVFPDHTHYFCEEIESLKNEKSPGIVLEFCYPISVPTRVLCNLISLNFPPEKMFNPWLTHRVPIQDSDQPVSLGWGYMPTSTFCYTQLISA